MKLKLQKKPLKALSSQATLNAKATPQIGGGVQQTEWCSGGLNCFETYPCMFTDNKNDCLKM
ncbi:hypothetical protein ACSLBF_13675 [Pseudoalteromonas sp. T1lg65]|uniref:hypothetical protein n=1 Tax=Pseudoalteromonas sp. T1lg65 TaxID=2077101 RepID=UPI003F7A6CE3